MSSQQLRVLEWAVMALALALRVGAWWGIGETAYADAPLVDAYTYWDQARSLSEGDDPFAEGYYQPPGYPWILAALYSLTGAADLATGRALNLALGLLTTGLLLRLGRQLAARAQAPLWLGAVTALLYTLYPTTLLFELDLLTPAVTNALLVGALALLLSQPAASAPRCVAAGLLLGGAAVVHPTVLVLAPVLFVWRLLQSGGARAAALPALALTLGVSAALAPTAWNNHTRWDESALVSHNAGLNFYIGNNPDWKTTSGLRAGLPFRQLVMQADPANRDTFARNDYWRDRTVEEIKEAPGVWLATLATKAVWSVNNREIPRNEDYRCRSNKPSLSWLNASPVRYGLVFPLAALGAVATLRSRERSLWLLVPGWLALQAGMVLFLVADRYRLSTWPLMVLLAGQGLPLLRALVLQLRQRALPSAWWVLWVGSVAAPWLWIDRSTAFQESWCWHQEGNFALQDQDYPTAQAAYERTLERDPDNIGTRHWLGVTLARQGEHAEAVRHFDKVLEVFPDNYQTLMAAASSQHKLKRYDREAERLGQACAIPGPRSNTCARYVQALVASGQRSAALGVLERRPELRRHERVKKLGL